MQDLYLNNIVDITDPQCQFIEDFNKEIKKYGAIVYNRENNSYQFIRQFDDIDYKKELLPDFIKVKNTDPLLKGLHLSIHYEFDPEIEEDEENLDIWNTEISKEELPYYEYDEDGEVYLSKSFPINTEVSEHTIWFLNKDSYDYILDIDLLMISPIIKNLNIARKLIKEYGIHPFEFKLDKEDENYQMPELPVYHHHDHEEEN